MDKPVLTRQYRWMIARRKKGLCVICGEPAAKLKFLMGTRRTSCMCEKHLAERRKRSRVKKIDGNGEKQ